MTLILRDTKGSRLRGVAFETVVIKDPVAISILMKYKAAGRVRLFNGTSADFSALYKSAVAFFRLSHPKPTPHGIRRGGLLGIFRSMAHTTEPSSTVGGRRCEVLGYIYIYIY